MTGRQPDSIDAELMDVVTAQAGRHAAKVLAADPDGPRAFSFILGGRGGFSKSRKVAPALDRGPR